MKLYACARELDPVYQLLLDDNVGIEVPDEVGQRLMDTWEDFVESQREIYQLFEKEVG